MRRVPALLLCLPLALGPLHAAEEPAAARQLIGLWSARRHFGPAVRGPLRIEQGATAWTAEIAGVRADVRLDGDRLSATLPDNQGSFRGRLLRDGRIRGHWTQPRTVAWGQALATPVVLERRAPGRWRGLVTPLDDEVTLSLRVHMSGGHGSSEPARVTAFVRNPEAHAGRPLLVQEVVLEGDVVTLMGRRAKEEPLGELARGRYDAEARVVSLYLPALGGTFDFRRATSSGEAQFHPRARVPGPYVYRPPGEDGDGWAVGTLAEAGLAADKVAELMKSLVNQPVDGGDAAGIHALLVARRGKLVLEEYFHAVHRDQPHDTRSASGVLAPMLAGAAALGGTSLRPDGLPALSAAEGCADAGPGLTGRDCSANADTAAAAVATASGRPLAELFEDLVAEPLQFGPHALAVTSPGEVSLARARLRARDLLKLGQVLLDGGRWRGRAVMSADWARAATSPVREAGEERFGLQWWALELPYKTKERKVRAFYAAGDGGQLLLVVPELELAVAFLGGLYGAETGQLLLRVLVPGYILPAVD